MSFETITLLLNWSAMRVLLAILFRLSSTFQLIASTQRELRRAIHHVGQRRAAELGREVHFAAGPCRQRAQKKIAEGGAGVRAATLPPADDVVALGDEVSRAPEVEVRKRRRNAESRSPMSASDRPSSSRISGLAMESAAPST
jgi:hypothetical protein